MKDVIEMQAKYFIEFMNLGLRYTPRISVEAMDLMKLVDVSIPCIYKFFLCAD
jgi:hypothetical protein